MASATAPAQIRPGSSATHAETSEGGVESVIQTATTGSTVAGDVAEEVVNNTVEQLQDMVSPAPGDAETNLTAPPTSQGVSSLAGEVAQDMLNSMVDQLLGETVESVPGSAAGALPQNADSWPVEAKTRALQLKGLIDQLQAELSSARSELEFVTAEREELFKRQQDEQRKAHSLHGKMRTLQEDLNRQKADTAGAREAAAARAQEVAGLQKANEASHAERDQLQAELEGMGGAERKPEDPEETMKALEREVQNLTAQVQLLEEAKLMHQQKAEGGSSGLEAGPTASTMVPPQQVSSLDGPSADGIEGGASVPEQQMLLQAAYQQISVLNTQMAHLYTELTMARTELVSLRGGLAQGAAPGASSNLTSSVKDEVEKRNNQIADLVSDVRHLQLDLEYHQQKLDQMIEEKREMIGQLRTKHQELAEVRTALEERDQEIQHKDLDLQKSFVASGSQNPTGGGGAVVNVADEMAAALRSEVAAKDSALIVSHYELHKERVVRERLEGKNMHLMERLQKLMMVVENQRRERERIEERLSTADRACEDKDRQLSDISTKARQLQKLLKTQGLSESPRVSGKHGAKTARTPRSTSHGPQRPTGQGLAPESLPGISVGGGNPLLAETY